MYRVYFINFDYYADATFSTMEEALQRARKAGFDSRIEKDGIMVASWSILGGLREYRPN